MDILFMKKKKQTIVTHLFKNKKHEKRLYNYLERYDRKGQS